MLIHPKASASGVETHYEFHTPRVRVPIIFTSYDLAVGWYRDRLNSSPEYAKTLSLHKITTTKEEEHVDIN